MSKTLIRKICLHYDFMRINLLINLIVINIIVINFILVDPMACKKPIIFIIGGPGSGKGTQCEIIVQK